jgi:hypothetical protein
VTSIKLLKGSPNDIPSFIRDHFFGPQINFNLSIGVELACAFAALLYPRRMFAPLAALMTFFVGVLLVLIWQGATSCGCFGGAIKFPPWAMLCVDGSLLAFMLATRPWRAAGAARMPWPAIAMTTVIAFGAPWVLVRTGKVEAPKPAEAGTAAVWQLPPKPWPNWAELPVESWVGKSIHETELAAWMDTHGYPTDATWIIYRVTCPHCAAYLRRLFNEFAAEPKQYVFVRLSEVDEEKTRVVDAAQMPPGEEAVLPAEVNWGNQPPWELVLDGGVVRSAKFYGDEE